LAPLLPSFWRLVDHMKSVVHALIYDCF
jgi:hypothetical protein